jgi:hypothetical protein
MSDHKIWGSARNLQYLARFFLECANAGEVDGLVALCELDAILSV